MKYNKSAIIEQKQDSVFNSRRSILKSKNSSSNENNNSGIQSPELELSHRQSVTRDRSGGIILNANDGY